MYKYIYIVRLYKYIYNQIVQVSLYNQIVQILLYNQIGVLVDETQGLSLNFQRTEDIEEPDEPEPHPGVYV